MLAYEPVTLSAYYYSKFVIPRNVSPYHLQNKTMEIISKNAESESLHIISDLNKSALVITHQVSGLLKQIWWE